MYRFAVNLILISVFLLGMPLIGVWLAGHDLATYLVFPHITSPVQHEPFSWIAWIAMAGFIIVVLAFFVYAKLYEETLDMLLHHDLTAIHQ